MWISLSIKHERLDKRTEPYVIISELDRKENLLPCDSQINLVVAR